MSVEDHTTRVEYRTIARFAGHRFGSDGSIQCCLPRVRGKFHPIRWAEPGWWFVHQQPGRGGYLRVRLYEGGKRKVLLVHRLILEAFKGPCPGGLEARHLDSTRDNNAIGNLEWGTRSENTIDQVRCGRHHIIKLTIETAREAREAFKGGATRAELAKRYGLDRSTVWHLIAGTTWKHVT